VEVLRLRLAGGLLATVVALLICAAPAAAKGCPGAKLEPTSANAAKVSRATACLVNRARRKNGLKPLHINKRLGAAATNHARDMVANRYFDHIAPDGATLRMRAERVNYVRVNGGGYLAENIGYGPGSASAPGVLMKYWLKSPLHRANLLSRKVRDVGVGIAIGVPQGDDGATYTLDFGRV
jgi:uncharacterized protein YkwD